MKGANITEAIVDWLRDRPQGGSGSEIIEALRLNKKSAQERLWRAKAGGVLLAKDHPSPTANREQRFWHPDQREGWAAFRYDKRHDLRAMQKKARSRIKAGDGPADYSKAKKIDGGGFSGLHRYSVKPGEEVESRINSQECRDWARAAAP